MKESNWISPPLPLPLRNYWISPSSLLPFLGEKKVPKTISVRLVAPPLSSSFHSPSSTFPKSLNLKELRGKLWGSESSTAVAVVAGEKVLSGMGRERRNKRWEEQIFGVVGGELSRREEKEERKGVEKLTPRVNRARPRPAHARKQYSIWGLDRELETRKRRERRRRGWNIMTFHTPIPSHQRIFKAGFWEIQMGGAPGNMERKLSGTSLSSGHYMGGGKWLRIGERQGEEEGSKMLSHCYNCSGKAYYTPAWVEKWVKGRIKKVHSSWFPSTWKIKTHFEGKAPHIHQTNSTHTKGVVLCRYV